MKKFISYSIFIFFSFVTSAYAQFGLPGRNGGIGIPGGGGGQVERGINDPRLGLPSLFGTGGFLSGNWTVWDIVFLIIYLMLTFAGIVAVFFIILGGYYYMTAGGNGDQATKGKQTVFNAVIGLIIIILAYLIVQVVINTFSGGLLGTGIF